MFRRIWKWFWRIFWSLLIFLTVILLLVLVLVQIPSVQNYLAQKAVVYLSENLDTRVELEKLSITFTGNIKLEGIYIEDIYQDTLIYSNLLYVRIDPTLLGKREIRIHNLELSQAALNINRKHPAFKYNFEFFEGKHEDATHQDTISGQKDDDSEPWTFSVRRVALNNVRFNIADEQDGMFMKGNSGRLLLLMDDIDLDNLAFEISRLDLHNTQFYYTSTEPLIYSKPSIKSITPDPEKAASQHSDKPAAIHDHYDHTKDTLEEASRLPILNIQTLSLNNIRFRYLDHNNATGMNITTARANISPAVINVNDDVYTVGDADIRRFSFGWKAWEHSAVIPRIIPIPVEEKVTVDKPPMLIKADNLKLSGSRFTYNDYRQPEASDRAIDFSHMDFFSIALHTEDFSMQGTDVSALINNLQTKEKSGFELTELKGNLDLHNEAAELRDMFIKTPHSQLQDKIKITYPELWAFVHDYHALDFDIALHNSYLDLQDVLLFAPGLKEDPAISHNTGKTLQFEGLIKGTVEDMHFHDFNFQAGALTNLYINGRLKDMENPDEMYIDFPEIRLNTNKPDIHFLIPPEYLPEELHMFPRQLSLNGGYTGSLSDFQAHGVLKSDMGDVNGKVTMLLHENDAETTYSGNISAKDLELGVLTGVEDQLGKGTFTVDFDGKGISLETIDARMKGNLKSIDALNYTYTNLIFDGHFKQEFFDGNAEMDDPNLTFDFDGTIDMSAENPVYNARLNLVNADLKALGLMEDELRIQGKVLANFEGDNIDNIDGSVEFNEVYFITEELTYPLNRAVLTASTKTDTNRYAFDSDFAQAAFYGNIKLSTLPATLEEHLNYYFETPGSGYDTEVVTAQLFDFNIVISETILINHYILPDLEVEAPVTINGNYDSRDKQIKIDGYIPFIEYAGNELDSVSFNVHSDHQNLLYSFFTSRYKGSMAEINFLKSEGSFENNIFSGQVAILDTEREDRYRINLTAEMDDNHYRLHLPDEMLINYETWTTHIDNQLLISADTLWLDNFVIDGPRGQLSLQSIHKGDGQPDILEVNVSRLNLEHVMYVIQPDDIDISGNINATANLEYPLEAVNFTATAEITDIIYNSYESGDIKAEFSSESPDTAFHFDVHYQSRQLSAARLSGNYKPGERGGYWDLNLNSDELHLADFRGFALPNVTRLQGRLSADVTMEGYGDDLAFEGFMQFNETAFSTPYTRVLLSVDNERIDFSSDRILFNRFSIADSVGNTTVVDGSIFIEKLENPIFDLGITANNMLLMHTNRSDNRYFFGTALVNSDLRLSGPYIEPEISGRIALNERTDLHAEVPEFTPDAIGHEEVVNFVEWKREGQPIVPMERDDTVRTIFRGVEANIILSISRQTRLSVLIDPVAGDYLGLQGGGVLTIGMDPSGNVSISGSYDITEGTYQMTFYDVVRRRFDIRSGSSIIWTGDPLRADLNITAVYTHRTSPADLFAGQASGAAAESYRQPLPFQVFLNMNGNLANPVISFLLDMPAEHRGAAGGAVYSRIQQINENESERNKQVFALLVLNRFLPDSPTESPGAGSAIAGGARSSASRVLTHQLNHLSDRYVRGVDITFDVESYEGVYNGDASGRTELQMEVSRRFIDDRVEVRVGGNVDIEGERRREAGLSDFAGDVIIEYRLTEDGRLRMRGFRQHQYENIIDGEYVETGVSILFGRDFHRYRELFRKEE